MGYDAIFAVVGDFGLYQISIFLLLTLQAIFTGLHVFCNVFLSARPAFRCLLHGESLETATYELDEAKRNSSIPWDDARQEFSSCYFFANGTEMPCEAYVYDDSIYQSTTVTEYDIVCDQAYLRALEDSIVMVGTTVGCILFGALSDRYGRKPLIYAGCLLHTAIALLVGLVPYYWAFQLVRFLVGVLCYGTNMTVFVAGMEMVGSRKRNVTGTLLQACFTLGYISNVAFAYCLRNWRYYAIAISIPGIIFIPYYWLIPESGRWLVQQNQLTRARKQLKRIAKVNKVEITEDELDQLIRKIEISKLKATSTVTHNFFEVYKMKKLRRRTLFLHIMWFSNSAAYYGLVWSSGNLGGNDYLNFFIIGVVEFPAHAFLLLTMNVYGRKYPYIGTLLAASAFILAAAFMPTDYHWPRVICCTIGKMCVTASFVLLHVYTAELYPTVIRSTSVGMAAMVAKAGSVVAALLFLLETFWIPLPFLIIGALNGISTGLAYTLPETLNRELPETMDDAEQFI